MRRRSLTRAPCNARLQATAVGAGGLHLTSDFTSRRPRSLTFKQSGRGTNPGINNKASDQYGDTRENMLTQ